MYFLDMRETEGGRREEGRKRKGAIYIYIEREREREREREKGEILHLSVPWFRRDGSVVLLTTILVWSTSNRCK